MSDYRWNPCYCTCLVADGACDCECHKILAEPIKYEDDCKSCSCRGISVNGCACECHDGEGNPKNCNDTMDRVSKYLDKIEMMLEAKNCKYKDSCYHPKRVFSRASPIEQLKVRIDDKLSRICSESTDPFEDLARIMLRVVDGYVDDEDTIMDLIGYLVLLACAPKEGK